MKKCHGCDGKGWVDSQHVGPTKCPICEGEGVLSDQIRKTEPILDLKTKAINRNSFLRELERWLYTQPNISFSHSSKTMNTYKSFSSKSGRVMGIVWVSTDGTNRLYLRKGNYQPADHNSKVCYRTAKNESLWGGYPQFYVEDQTDIDYAKRLIKHAQDNL